MKNAKNGTSLREPKKSSFTSIEICRILESCKTAGVKEFVLGDLRFVFGGDEISPNVVPTKEQEPPSPLPVVDHAKQDSEALEIDEMYAREDRLALLAIEDPVEFERQIVHEELIPDDGSDTESDD